MGWFIGDPKPNMKWIFLPNSAIHKLCKINKVLSATKVSIILKYWIYFTISRGIQKFQELILSLSQSLAVNWRADLYTKVDLWIATCYSLASEIISFSDFPNFKKKFK